MATPARTTHRPERPRRSTAAIAAALIALLLVGAALFAVGVVVGRLTAADPERVAPVTVRMQLPEATVTVTTIETAPLPPLPAP